MPAETPDSNTGAGLGSQRNRVRLREVGARSRHRFSPTATFMQSPRQRVGEPVHAALSLHFSSLV